MAEDERQILVVEDDALIARDMAQLITECGCTPVGPVSNVADGLEAVRQTPLAGAVLDVNLGDDRVWAIADLLDKKKVMFILATGYTTTEVPQRFRDRLILHKPLHPDTLVAVLSEFCW
jgi:ActR/RegA family two-component response regulator